VAQHSPRARRSTAARPARLDHNPALPILVLLLWFLFEGVIVSLPIWRSLHLELVANSLPLTSVVALVSGARDPVSYGLGPPPDDPGVVVRPLLLSFAVVAGWAVAFLGAAARILSRADIRE
jgi:hypothetical protein